jgi:hypothetical protein
MLICRSFRTTANSHDNMNPPLHGGGQGFESPLLHIPNPLTYQQCLRVEKASARKKGATTPTGTPTRYENTSSIAATALSCIFGRTWE